jgi:hypothetical protein
MLVVNTGVPVEVKVVIIVAEEIVVVLEETQRWRSRIDTIMKR